MDTRDQRPASQVFRWQADEGLIDDGIGSVGELVRGATELFRNGFLGWPQGRSWPEDLRPVPEEIPNVF